MAREWTSEEQKEHREEWVKALRSGEYDQTRNALNDGTGYCCLGVACEISGLGEWRLADESDDTSSKMGFWPENEDLKYWVFSVLA